MKKYLFLLVASLLALPAQAQTPDPYPWCPPGATWVYQSFSQSSVIFYIFSYVGDTTIQEKVAKMLNVGRVVYLGDLGELRTENPHVGMEYLHNSNDSIFFLDNGTFNFMYRFNAQLNDTITLSNSRAGCSGDPNFPTSGQVVVDTFLQRVYGNFQFNLYWTNPLGAFKINSIMQNIGALSSPFPEIYSVPNFDCAFPFTDYGRRYVGLVCYSDSLRGNFSVNYSSYTCLDIKTNLETELAPTVDILLYTNPAAEVLFMEGLELLDSKYLVYNLQGKLILEGTTENNAVIVSSLVGGLYFIVVTTRSGQNFTLKFIKQRS